MISRINRVICCFDNLSRNKKTSCTTMKFLVSNLPGGKGIDVIVIERQKIHLGNFEQLKNHYKCVLQYQSTLRGLEFLVVRPEQQGIIKISDQSFWRDSRQIRKKLISFRWLDCGLMFCVVYRKYSEKKQSMHFEYFFTNKECLMAEPWSWRSLDYRDEWQ